MKEPKFKVGQTVFVLLNNPTRGILDRSPCVYTQCHYVEFEKYTIIDIPDVYPYNKGAETVYKCSKRDGFYTYIYESNIFHSFDDYKQKRIEYLKETAFKKRENILLKTLFL